MNNYLLSIAIPTYNRVNFLLPCIESFIHEPGFEKVQLVISDNHSTDNTESMVAEFVAFHHNIKYHKNSENIGLEANIKQVIELADGEFIKVINDYTNIEKGQLALLIKYLEQYVEEKPNLFFYNNSNGLSPVECDSLNKFISNVSYWSTWISCFGIWKIDYENIINKKNHFGFLFYQTSILLELVSKKKTTIIQDKFFASTDISNKGGYHLAVFLNGYFAQLIQQYYERGFISKSVYLKEKKNLIKFLYPYIVDTVIKHKKSFGNDGLYKVLWNYYKTEFYFYPFVIKYFLTFVLYNKMIKRIKASR